MAEYSTKCPPEHILDELFIECWFTKPIAQKKQTNTQAKVNIIIVVDANSMAKVTAPYDQLKQCIFHIQLKLF